jgi:hypothetical protein
MTAASNALAKAKTGGIDAGRARDQTVISCEKDKS